MNITIRSVSPILWRELKIEAVKEGISIGEAINLALDKWIRDRGKDGRKKAKSFWDLKPVAYKGKDAKLLSTKIDEVLYG